MEWDAPHTSNILGEPVGKNLIEVRRYPVNPPTRREGLCPTCWHAALFTVQMIQDWINENGPQYRVADPAVWCHDCKKYIDSTTIV